MRSRKTKKSNKKSRSKKLLKKYIFILMVFSILIRLGWNILLNMDYLGIDTEKIVITGNKMVSDNEIFDMLGLKDGQNILSIDTEMLESKLQALDRLESVRVQRDFPDAMKVTVEEVVPAGYLMKEGRRYVVTVNGKNFEGLEGPMIEFKQTDPHRTVLMSGLLEDIRGTDADYYNTITGIDLNYRLEVIIYHNDYYIKWPVITGIDKSSINKYIYFIEKMINKSRKEGKKMEYADLRFLDLVDGRIKGAVIIK
ncbi:cell division protein FtsQ/DivIB [Elusimicrobiota bacterium]